MPEIQPIAPGIHARSEHLVQVTRDHDRDRVTDDELHEAQARDLENLIGIQARAGFELVTPGLLTWQDHFRPFEAIVDGLEAETLTRFIDTNTFYRRPELDDPQLDRDALPAFVEQAFPSTGTATALYTIPSPTAWVTAARDEDGNYPDPGLATQIAEDVYQPLLDELTDRAGAIALADPWLGTYPDPASLTEALEPVAGLADLDLVLQLAFQDGQPAIEAGLTDAVDAAVIDLHRTDRAALAQLPDDTTPGLGLIDARSSLIEREDLIVSSLDSALQTIDAETVYLAPNGSLQHVPETIARQKLRIVGQAAETATAKLGGDR